MPRTYKARLAKPTKATLVAESEPVTIKAGLADGDSQPGPPTFEGVAYSGGVVPRHTLNVKLDADYIIDLAGFAAGKNVKANLDHNPTQRVGHVTSVANDKRQVVLSGVLSAATPFRDQVANSAANGYAWEQSVETDLYKPQKLEHGKTATVNGRQVTGPLYIFRKSTLTGLGFVDHGADTGNNVKVAATAAGAQDMNEFEKFAASLGVDLETASESQKAALTAAFNAAEKESSASPAAKTLAQLAEAQRLDHEREQKINAICSAAFREHPMYIEQIKALGELAIENKQSPDLFELELIRATRSKAGTFSSQRTARDANPAVIEAALCMASGLPHIEKYYSEQTLDGVDRAGLRNNFSLQGLLLQVASSNGYSCRAGERIGPQNIRAVLEYCFPPAHASLSGFSTVSLPGILGNVANKQILAGYMEEDPTWMDIAEVGIASNFHDHTHFRLLDSLEYEEVGPTGEIKHGTLDQESYTTKVKTYGKMLALTREQIINDDLGAFNDMRTRLGRGAAKKFNNVFWAAFMDNATFFTTARTNYIEGATTNLGNDGVGLELGVKAFRQMKSPLADGAKRIGIGMTPRLLLVPPELEFIADRLHVSGSFITGASTTLPSENIHRNKYRPVVQSRLSDSAFTGFSLTAWYLFSAEVKPMKVTFLNGQRTPTVESTDADFQTLGIQFRGYHDFGCDKGEYLSGIKSKGAA